MSDSRLSFYPEEEDVGRQYSVVEREPGQLEEIFRSCRLVSRDLFSQAQQAATTASDQAQGASIVSYELPCWQGEPAGCLSSP